MPQVELNTDINKRGIKYSKKNGIFKPDYSEIHLENGIKIKMTATTRCGFFNIKFPEKSKHFIVFDASRDKEDFGFIKIIPKKNLIVGYNPDRDSKHLSNKKLTNFRGYFAIKFNNNLKSSGFYKNDSIIILNKDELKCNNIGAFIEFHENEVEFSIATSFISIEQALENMQKEIANKSFSQTKCELNSEWNNYLSRIKVKCEDTDKLTIFYTALYRSLLLPRTFSEYGKYYSAFDDTIHYGVSYNDYSLWDTYRTLHPLLLFIAPEKVNSMIQSLIQMYEEGGWLPKWPNPSYTNIMIGTHADAVIADAYIKGFRDFDAEKAYEAMCKNAMIPPDNDSTFNWHDRMNNAPYEARGGLTYYKKLGYVPCDKTKESVSRTIEFSYNDFCVAQMAKALGKEDDYNFYLDRSKNYKNLFNKERGIFAPKLSNGDWSSDTTVKYLPRWKAYKAKGFTEGGPNTYLFGAMHDIPGLINLMGGKENFKNKLDFVFDSGYYKHENEPGHHYIYLYNFIDEYKTTQKLLKKHIPENYWNAPGGLTGNEDCGQMSAWFVMSALGFYPLPPGSDQYAIGVPQFEEITLTKPDGSSLVIMNKKLKSVIKEIHIDNSILQGKFINHNHILEADSIIFE
jgi:predicted alpha-1,2-mannosidase